MEKEKMEALLIDYIDDRLNAVDKQTIEHELRNNADARKLYGELKEVISLMEHSSTFDPSPKLKHNFEKDLSKAIAGASGGRAIIFTPAFYKMAAAVALMVISGAVGYWISKDRQQRDELTQIQKDMAITRQQLAETKQVMLGLLDNAASASQRIKGVNVALEISSADEDIVKALFATLHSDPNTNVRLAALDALAKFRHEPLVRKGLIDALSKQTDPMVQITLIQLMVDLKEKSVVGDLQKMVDDAGTMKAVKDEAYSGILKLS